MLQVVAVAHAVQRHRGGFPWTVGDAELPVWGRQGILRNQSVATGSIEVQRHSRPASVVSASMPRAPRALAKVVPVPRIRLRLPSVGDWLKSALRESRRIALATRSGSNVQASFRISRN